MCVTVCTWPEIIQGLKNVLVSKDVILRCLRGAGMAQWPQLSPPGFPPSSKTKTLNSNWTRIKDPYKYQLRLMWVINVVISIFFQKVDLLLFGSSKCRKL